MRLSLETIPLEVLVGQLFVVAMLPESSLKAAMVDHRQNNYGGIFLRRSNLRFTDRTRRLTYGFRRHTRDVPPQLVCVDEEGGLVSSMARLTVPAPSLGLLGGIDNEALTKDVHQGIGEKLMALGINTVFGPVVDVNTETANPVIGTRSFGSDPDLVSRHGKAALAGFQAAGIASCAKHFPGHGSTHLDSHLALPEVDDAREVLDERDIYPFQELLAGTPQPDLVMTAHVAYKHLDKAGVPATLSRTIVQDLLRRDMRFQGLVISDSMDMKAITENYDPTKAAIKALEAGVDLLLYGEDAKLAAQAYQGVLQAVKSKKLSVERIAESVDRSFVLRNRFRGQSWIDDDRAEEILRFDHDQSFYRASLQGLILEGNAGALNDLRGQARKLLVIPREVSRRRLPLNVVREQLLPEGYRVIETSAEPTAEEITTAKASADIADAIVVATASRGPMSEVTRRMVATLTTRDVPKVGVALLDPADADQMATTNCRIKTLGFSSPQLWALCQTLIDGPSKKSL